MSSSQLRSVRHTATVVAMDLESALCEVAAEVEKEVVIVARQREGEKKRAGNAKGKGRAKEFEGKAEEVRERRNKLNEYLREFFDGCVGDVDVLILLNVLQGIRASLQGS